MTCSSLIEDVAGWFYLKGAGLSHEQRERVLSVFPDEHYPVDTLKSTLVRFFTGIHPFARLADEGTAEVDEASVVEGKGQVCPPCPPG